LFAELAEISRHYATEQLLRPGSSSVSEGALDGADRVEELERHADDATGSTTATTTTTTTTRTSPLSSSSSSSSSSSGSAYRGSSHLTGQKAQEYLTELLHLDPSRQFSPKLALQILTHKSYRFTYLPQTPHLHPAPTPAEVENAQTAAHNARLSFLGRRAIASYLTMFLHAAMASEGQTLRSVSLLRPTESLSEKLDNMMHVVNVGRAVGRKWGLDKVTRWDGNQVSRGFSLRIRWFWCVVPFR
jgi:dsRNA-specific ribonuclease